jgi:hypothetical protein
LERKQNGNESSNCGKCNANFYSSCTKFVTLKQYWSYLYKNFKFQNGTSRSMPLHYVAMLQPIITVIEASLISTPIHIVDGVKSRPQTPTWTKFVSLHEHIPKEVNIIFANHPFDPEEMAQIHQDHHDL